MYSQSWIIHCKQQQQQGFIYHNRQMIKEKKRYFCSTKVYNNRNCYQTLNDYFVKSPDLPNDQDVSLPIYRAPCTFQSSFVTTIKDGHSYGIFRRSPISSSCVPDVYSPGLLSGGNCSPPPPSSNLPPPPSEWLNDH